LVKSFEIFQGFLGYFSFCHNIHFLSVTPDEICFDSNALHDKIVKEDKLLVNVHFYTIMRYELMKWKIIADSGYKTPSIAKFLLEKGITPVFPYTRPRGKKNFLRPKDFVYDEHFYYYLCPEN